MILLEYAPVVAVFLIATAMFAAICIQALCGWQLHRERRTDEPIDPTSTDEWSI